MAKKDWEKMSKHELLKHNQDCDEFDCKYCDELGKRLNEEEAKTKETDPVANRIEDQDEVITDIDLEQIQQMVEKTAEEETLSIMHDVKTTVDDLSTAVYEIKDTLQERESAPSDGEPEYNSVPITEFRITIDESQLDMIADMVVNKLSMRLVSTEYRLTAVTEKKPKTETRKTLVAKKDKENA